MNSPEVNALLAEAKAALQAGDFTLSGQKLTAARTAQEDHLATLGEARIQQQSRFEKIGKGLQAVSAIAALLGQ